MFHFLQLANGIQILYKYVKDEILESDFLELSDEMYKKLTDTEKSKKWYTLNPDKLNKNYINEQSVFILDEKEKEILLRSVEFIKEKAKELPSDASFLEKLLYNKKFLPPIFYSDLGEDTDGEIVELSKKSF